MYAGGVEMDMYIVMSVRIALPVSRWMCSGSVLYYHDAEQVQYL